jgi:hypothetical protein
MDAARLVLTRALVWIAWLAGLVLVDPLPKTKVHDPSKRTLKNQLFD